MRPHLTVVALLVVGTFMSGTGGVGLAYDGLGQSGDNAAEAQYGPPRPVESTGPTNQPLRGGGEPEGPPMLGPGDAGPGPGSGPGPRPGPGTSPGMGQAERLDVGAAGGPPPPEVQVARQVEAGSSLPFTGFAAIPLLVLGMGLVVTGLVLRRR